ncbi:hypothetical protein IXB50_00775 [Leptothoe spongobia TAU-MAC 1115]|uniref:Uncharacterized protein n=2 Tax=Leptothoe TaxID=2651725 RepID=A0A947DAQ0_9CYAN|nr:hypothetical protein [Leptothoe spongobia TAU-MAC 1115]
MALIQSLVEHRTFIIDDSIFSRTGDKVFFNQHFYSDKPPILAILASPIYFVLYRLGISLASQEWLAYYLITLLSIGILSALGLAVFRKIIKDFCLASDEWSDLVTFIVGTGTLLLPYSLLFNNHAPSGVLILIGFYFLLDFRRTVKLKQAVYAGLVFSLAGGIDITQFLFLPFVFILFAIRSLKAGLTFAIACLPIIALYLFLNLHTSGSFLPPAMNASLWDYPGSAFGPENLSALAKHDSIANVLFYAFHMLIGNRGLLSHTPLLLLAILGLGATFKANWRFRYKTEYICLLFVCLLYVGIYIYKSINYSGWAYGVRWFVSPIFFLCLSIAWLENAVRSSRLMRLFFVGLTCLSILISLIGTYKPFTPLPYVDADSKGRLHPVNTIVVGAHLIMQDLYNPSIPDRSKRELFLGARLIIGTVAIYSLFFKLMKNLSPLPHKD